ncbi:MAG: acetyl-CoA acetyltransferase, partial [Chloroflexi bacterium]|nr:acetyl-CoA acetyltransferase [Chloroflexota bacterium]
MENMRDKVAIIGMGCTKYDDHFDKTGEDLLVEACYEAFADAGVSQDDIQAGWLGGGITGQTLAHALKLNFVPVTRIENWCATGSDTFRNAAAFVAGGLYDIALVAGFTAGSDAARAERGVLNGSFGWLVGEETVFSGPAAGTFSTFVTRYMHHYGLTYEQAKIGLGSIAIKNYHNAMLNPKAYLHKEIDMNTYMNAPVISWPFGLHDCCCSPHGAAAAVITTPELAKKFRDDYIVLKGNGMSVGTKRGRLDSNYDWVHFDENTYAARMAYGNAGIKNPLKELDVIAMHDAFTVVEMAFYEDMGLAPRGKGGEYAAAGVFSLEGELPVNTNG